MGLGQQRRRRRAALLRSEVAQPTERHHLGAIFGVERAGGCGGALCAPRRPQPMSDLKWAASPKTAAFSSGAATWVQGVQSWQSFDASAHSKR